MRREKRSATGPSSAPPMNDGMNAIANVAAASSGDPVCGEHEQGERDAGDLVARLARDLREDDAAELAHGEDVADRRAGALPGPTALRLDAHA